MRRLSTGSSRTIRVGSVTACLLCVISALWAEHVAAGSLREEQHCLALNLYWEARGEGRLGMIAVGWTVLNRVRSGRFPSTPCGVIYQGGERPPCEFSWWCDGRSDRPTESRSWRQAQIIAARLLLDPPPDPTGGSLFYHSTSVRPQWRHKRTARIGRHIFYR